MGRRGRRGQLVWVAVALMLLLVLPELAAAASTGEDPESKATGGAAATEQQPDAEDDDEWEDFEEDDEVSLAAASSNKAVGRAVKALPQLNDQNADRILASTEYVLLLGYASWCKQSAAVMIDFADAATVLAAKRSPAVLAKIDAVANQITANRYKIKGYPTIIFLTNGSAEFYTAGQTRDDIVTWVQKRTGQPATTFTTEAEAQQLQSRDITVVIGLFEKFEGPEYEEFLAASVAVVDVEFLHTTNAEAAKVFNVQFDDVAPAIAIWKSEPEKFLRFGGEMKRRDIVEFVALNKHALVTKLHARNAGKIYTSPVKKQVLLFANSYDYDSIYPFYLAAARYFKGEHVASNKENIVICSTRMLASYFDMNDWLKQLLFLWVDIEDEDFAKPMTTMYGIIGSEPTVAGFDNTNGSRYLLEAEVTRQNLKAFSIHFKAGRLKLHYKSEPVPKKNKGDVKIIVGKTFEKLVLKSSKDVLLMVYTSYCHDCETLGKVFVKLAKHFKGVSSMVFGKLDATANDHPELQVQNYPAFLLYQASSKNSPPVEGPEKPNFKKLVQFVEENHVGLLSTAKGETNSETKPSDSETNLPPKDVQVQNPIGTVSRDEPKVSLVQEEAVKLQGSQSTDAMKDELSASEEAPKIEDKSKVAEVEAHNIGSDPLVTTLEFPAMTGIKDEIIPKFTPVKEDTQKLQESIEEPNNNDISSTKLDSESEVQSILTVVDKLEQKDIISDPLVTSLEPPKLIDTENAPTESIIEEIDSLKNTHEVSTSEVPKLHSVLNGNGEEFLKAGNIASESTVTKVEPPKGSKTEIESESKASADEELQDFQSRDHDEL